MGRDFNLTCDDIEVPDRCPCCKRAFNFNARKQERASPSLDRIDNAMGYVPGNVAVCCFGCNRRKGAASLVELQQMVAWLEGLQGVAESLQGL